MKTYKENILSFFKDVTFEEKTHRYFLNGKKLKNSVSSLLKDFSNPFDSKKVSQLYAEKNNLTQKEVLKLWEKAKKDSCLLGKNVHAFAESFFIDRSLKPSNGYEKAVVKFFKSIPKDIHPILSELRMYNERLSLAGTADLLLYNEISKKFLLVDFKTNKDLFKNYNNQTFIKEPFLNLLDTPFNKYQLQLNLYQILFEQTDFKIENKIIIWLSEIGNFKFFKTEDYTTKLKEYLK